MVKRLQHLTHLRNGGIPGQTSSSARLKDDGILCRSSREETTKLEGVKAPYALRKSRV